MRRAVVGLSLIGLVALAGCSSSSGSGAASSTTPSPTQSSAAADIVGVASATPDLSTLVTAVKAAGLVSTLQGTGPYTVFAPTNEAFAALPAGVVDSLLLSCNKDALTKVLTYHVVSGKVMSTDIQPGKVATVEGQTVKLGTSGGVTVNDANVVTADVPASNGVVHVIDKVLVPSDVDVSMLKTSC
jgi:uncharacterized surface protein with fasciclin (FAS1) repeats